MDQALWCAKSWALFIPWAMFTVAKHMSTPGCYPLFLFYCGEHRGLVLVCFAVLLG